MSFSKKKKSINKSTVLIFPDTLKVVDFDGYAIVISPLTANWLSLTQEELELFFDLQSGLSVGKVFDVARGRGAAAPFNKLLAQILARDFARENLPPTPIPPQILGAHFYLTNACNLQCAHCYMHSGKRDLNELSLQEWIRVTDEFAACGGKSITFSGGEILVKKEWFEILLNAKDKNISSTILTNGTMWSDQHIKEAAPLIEEVQISIDGPNEQINSYTRGDGYFAKSLETAKSFSKAGVRTSIAMTPTLETIYDFEDGFLDFFNNHIKSHGIYLKISQKLLPDRNGRILSKSEEDFYFEKTKALADLVYSTSSSIRNFSLGHKPNEIQKNCGFGGLTVSASGEIYPCNRISDLCSYGDVRSKSIKEIMRYFASMDLYTSVDKVEPCRYCDLRYICGGGCRLDEYTVNGPSAGVNSFKESRIAEDSKLIKISCAESHRASILKKMVSVRGYLYGV